MQVDDVIGDNRYCYYVDPSQDITTYGGYVPSVVVEGKPGHYPLLGNGLHASPWVWGSDIELAERIAEDRNRRLGLSPEDIALIITSSMGTQLMRSNLDRAVRAVAALDTWSACGGSRTDEGDLSDLLADLMHLARLTRSRPAQRDAVLGAYAGEKWDFEVELTRARSNFESERLAPRWDAEFTGL